MQLFQKKIALSVLAINILINTTTKPFEIDPETQKTLLQGAATIGSVLVSTYLTAIILQKAIRPPENNYGAEKTEKFSSLIGGAPEEALIAIKQLKDPDRYKKLIDEPPKSILLYGPPGNGKTLLAKAFAGELDADFLYSNAASFTDTYVGAGPRAIRSLFNQAKKPEGIFSQFLSFLTRRKESPKKPTVIFIDELDAVGLQRTEKTHAEDRKTINQLLTEMDGVGSAKNVIVIAATNADTSRIDNALISRFNYGIKLNNPNKNKRLQLLQHFTKEKLKEPISFQELENQTDGFSTRDIKTVCDNAARSAIYDGRELISLTDLQKSVANKRQEITQRSHKRSEQQAFPNQPNVITGDCTIIQYVASAH